jgi:ribosomal protein S18 acetylase RimI-like enzyme
MTTQQEATARMFKTTLKVDCRAVMDRDWKQIERIEETYDWPVPLELAQKLYRKKVINVFVAEYEGHIVGWCSWKLKNDDSKSVFIVRLVVHEQFRRMSVGTQMVDMLKDGWGKARPIHTLVRETNDDAIGFFCANGFLGRGVEPVSPESFDDEIVDDYRFEYLAPGKKETRN